MSLGYSSIGPGKKYSLTGRYSQVKGEYHGGWANFEEWIISWDFNRIYQLDMKNNDEPGWYIKKGNIWIKE